MISLINDSSAMITSFRPEIGLYAGTRKRW